MLILSVVHHVPKIQYDGANTESMQAVCYQIKSNQSNVRLLIGMT